MRFTDIAVICAYFLLLPLVAIMVSRRGKTPGDFLSASHDLPWWAICLSLVATETSTLTFISIPGIGYTSGMVFLGLAGGYLIGRLIVAIWFLPLYAQGQIRSAYQYLGERFGPRLQCAASGAFLVTRLLAEGVRLSAGLLPLTWMLEHNGIFLNHLLVLTLIIAFTLAYTVLGGLRAVVWSDTIQLCIYLFGAAACAFLLMHDLPSDGWTLAWTAGKMSPFHTLHVRTLLSDPFTPLAALVGGGILSVASHGSDQLMVQRLLAARNLRDARYALVGSAFVVAFLFGLLSLVGVQLWITHQGASLTALGLHSPDELFPSYIVSGLPAGLGGLLLAGVLSATMGSLSSTLNAMAGASLTDFGPLPARLLRRWGQSFGLRESPLFAARLMTLLWSVALVLAALWFTQGDQSAVILGLTIAGWSYGPTLGAFLFGMFYPAARARDALVGFLTSLAGMAATMTFLQYAGYHLAFPWLVPLGIAGMLIAARFSMLLSGLSRQEFQSAHDARKDWGQ
ncbi:sodium:solute symporter [Gluconobacter roseus]|uniref:sodium:solute symporter n=1 Tax=Gluconobacter roseus TaxID=586239 RepID=UPI0038CFD527